MFQTTNQMSERQTVGGRWFVVDPISKECFSLPQYFQNIALPRSFMYGIFTYIWVIYGVDVGKYTIHG